MRDTNEAVSECWCQCHPVLFKIVSPPPPLEAIGRGRLKVQGLQSKTIHPYLPLSNSLYIPAAFLYVYTYISSIYTRFKIKIDNHEIRQVFRTWNVSYQIRQVFRSSTSKNLFKEINNVTSNAPGRSTSFEKILVG